ncbi:MAG: glycosyltransferase family 2 protein [Candidatus Saccharimonadales bacterium]
MYWLVGLLLSLALLEVAVCYMPIANSQKYLAAILAAVVGLDSMLMLYFRTSFWALLVLYISCFRVINLIRLAVARKQADYLRRTFVRSSISLATYQGLIILAAYLINLSKLQYRYRWTIVICLQLVCLLTVVMSIQRQHKKTRPKLVTELNPIGSLPTLSVAIPARNETEDLEACLSSLIACDYPKLEILVLDDCSQEKRTPEIIRQFAHDGVRFIEGEEAGSSWTAKNYAYQKLLEVANGEVILFCGCDVRFSKQTLRQMVELKLSKNKRMMSFMPINYLRSNKLKSSLFQPLRYLWEVGLPRRFINRPPVLSTCWLIDRKYIQDFGGFKAVSRSIVPERYFARQSARRDDGYSFVCLGRELGFSSVKDFSEQQATTLRTRYPLLRKRLENVSIVSLMEFMVFIAPLGLFIYGILITDWWLMTLSVANILVAGYILYALNKLTYGRKLLLSFMYYPVIFAYDIGLLIYSMWLYEFKEVLWKGRNVCIPVMRVLPNNKP